MKPLLQEIDPQPGPDAVSQSLGPETLPVLLRSGGELSGQSRYSLLAAFPLQFFSSLGARCEWQVTGTGERTVQFGNPWQLLGAQLARYEVLDEADCPFPTGGCFGFWGYDLKQFIEPKVGRVALNDVEFPDCRVGFYPSLLVWDHQLERAWIVATGLELDGTRQPRTARRQMDRWKQALEMARTSTPAIRENAITAAGVLAGSMDREQYVQAVLRALAYIRQGDIYQVNLSHRWSRAFNGDPWDLFTSLTAVSPAPFAAYQRWEDMAVISTSPEQFLRISGNAITSRPIKGTRPRSRDPNEDARLAYELQSSEKERAELVMITDLLRNDLGRVCEFGSVQVPELLRLERFSHVQHLVSTVSGRLRAGVSHLEALAACFPGGSITGAPKVRAMQIIDELEPVARGPYTGCLGYLGFNRESQLSILIRSAFIRAGHVYYHAGAGIVADSDPAAEYEETLVKARAFFQANNQRVPSCT